MINYIFEIDVKGEKTKYSDVVLTSGDKGAARFSFSFKDGKEPFETEGMLLLLKAKRADGIVITDTGCFENGKFYIDIKNSMTSIAGELSFEVALTDENESLVTVSEIICMVREGYGEENLEASDTAPVLAVLSSRALSAENSAQSAENSAQSAENSAQSAENYAQETKEAAERIEAELSGMETAIDNIIAIQNTLTGGETA